jgi:hypothetical protein
MNTCKLWWQGPEWLNQHQRQWPTIQLEKHPEPMLECEVVTVKIQCFPAVFINRFSTSSSPQRRAPDCLEICSHCKKAYNIMLCHNQKSYKMRNPSLRKTSYLTSKEFRDALHACIKMA